MVDTTRRCKDCCHAKELKSPNAGELRDCTLLYNIVCGRRPACRFFNMDEEVFRKATGEDNESISNSTSNS